MIYIFLMCNAYALALKLAATKCEMLTPIGQHKNYSGNGWEGSKTSQNSKPQNQKSKLQTPKSKIQNPKHTQNKKRGLENVSAIKWKSSP